MNIHHLELFYYVALSRGISRAIPHIPYGIQQPAISSQILQLEQLLDTKLFERSPFKLTEEGELLYAFVQPFFSNLGNVATQLSRRVQTQLRIGASELVLRDHLPHVIHRVRARHPCTRLVMSSGLQPQLEADIRERRLDLAIVTAMDFRIGTGLQKLSLVRMPLVLLVHTDSPITSARELWSQRTIEHPLISLPASNSSFQKGLRRHKVVWQPSIEASSLQLVTWYVANGYGIGVNVNVPDVVRHPSVRALPLDGFDPVEIAAVWQGQASALLRTVLEEAQAYCRESWPNLANKEGIPEETPASPSKRLVAKGEARNDLILKFPSTFRPDSRAS